MIWFKDLFDKEKIPTFSPLGISPDMENEYLFFEMVENEPPYSLKNLIDYYNEKGVKFKPHYLKAVERKIRKGDFKNPLKFPDYFDCQFDFVSMAFQFGNFPKEIVCDLGLAFVKNGELVYWINYKILPPDEEDMILLPKDRVAGLHEIEHVQSFKKLWDSTLSEICNTNLLVIYDSVVELSILKSLFLNYSIEDFNIWYTDVLSLADLSGNSERLAELDRKYGIIVKQEFDAKEDAVTCANVFHEISKVYPNYLKHVSYLDLGST